MKENDDVASFNWKVSSGRDVDDGVGVGGDVNGRRDGVDGGRDVVNADDVSDGKKNSGGEEGRRE